MLTYTQVYTLYQNAHTHTHTNAHLEKEKKKNRKKTTQQHIFHLTHQQTRKLPDNFFFFFFLFNTDESKIHPHFHSEEGAMAPLNTARLGDLSPSLGLTYKHIFAHLLLPFLTLSFSRPSLLFPARIRFPTVSWRNCTAYSLSLNHSLSLTHTHTHTRARYLSVFKLSQFCARALVCVCVRVSLLPAHFLNKGHSCCRFALNKRWQSRNIWRLAANETMILSNLNSDISCITSTPRVNCDMIMFATEWELFSSAQRDSLTPSLPHPSLFCSLTPPPPPPPPPPPLPRTYLLWPSLCL